MKAKATREKLLETVRELFESGNLDTSKNLVADLVGGSKGTVFELMNMNENAIAELRAEVIAQPNAVRDAAVAFGETVWLTADAERRAKDKNDTARYQRSIELSHKEIERQLEANRLIAEAYDEQALELERVRHELSEIQIKLKKAQESETRLRHRADAAEAATNARTDLIAVLHKLGVSVPTGTEIDYHSAADDGGGNSGGNSSASKGAYDRSTSKSESVRQQTDIEDYLVVTGKTDPSSGGGGE